MTSSAAAALAVLFFLPWFRISCANQALAQPSGYNIATFSPDDKTLGTLTALYEIESGPRRTQNGGWAESADKIIRTIRENRPYAVRIELVVYAVGVVMMFVLGVAVLLRGEGPTESPRRNRRHRPLPRSGQTSVMAVVVLLSLICVGSLVYFFVDVARNLLDAPPPPIVEIGFTPYFYLSGAICLALALTGTVKSLSRQR